MQHASRLINAPEGCCRDAPERRSTTGRPTHNLVEIERRGQTLRQTREEVLEGYAALASIDTRLASLQPAVC